MNTHAKETHVTKPSNGTSSQPNDERLLTIRASQVNLPYPPPSIITQYSQAIPGLGEKVIELIDKEVSHRRECERQALQSDIKLRNDTANNERLEILSRLIPRILGQVFAFVLCMAVLGAGVWLAFLGKEIAGSIIGTGGLAGLAWVFMHGNKDKEVPAKATRRK